MAGIDTLLTHVACHDETFTGDLGAFIARWAFRTGRNNPSLLVAMGGDRHVRDLARAAGIHPSALARNPGLDDDELDDLVAARDQLIIAAITSNRLAIRLLAEHPSDDETRRIAENRDLNAATRAAAIDIRTANGWPVNDLIADILNNTEIWALLDDDTVAAIADTTTIDDYSTPNSADTLPTARRALLARLDAVAPHSELADWLTAQGPWIDTTNGYLAGTLHQLVDVAQGGPHPELDALTHTIGRTAPHIAPDDRNVISSFLVANPAVDDTTRLRMAITSQSAGWGLDQLATYLAHATDIGPAVDAIAEAPATLDITTCPLPADALVAELRRRHPDLLIEAVGDALENPDWARSAIAELPVAHLDTLGTPALAALAAYLDYDNDVLAVLCGITGDDDATLTVADAVANARRLTGH